MASVDILEMIFSVLCEVGFLGSRVTGFKKKINFVWNPLSEQE